ncbi:hypothetical protein PAXRUDRAFT_19979 [Paxillus rubicundulus Ve08.2h10]|uniref:Uncharacterized protein n=1 Tax=Paxillus rubicundulus Ve08.2h10 TaxID=930991 RepID=A0A0D0D313_9AGAM|nr:hypothetical protein PAXRUDRAFT_19979 [Paxillus rubicundulus Ve08.2h10]
MQDRDEQEQFHVMDRLGKIFSNLQCLPTTVATSQKVLGKPWVVDKHGKVKFVTNPMFYKIRGLAETGMMAVQQRAGPRVIKPMAEFPLDMYHSAGYDGLVARQNIFLERRKLCLAREQKSSKSKRARRPPPRRRRLPSSSSLQEALPAPTSLPVENRDMLTQELFGPECGDVSMEDAIENDHADVSMEDPTGITGASDHPNSDEEHEQLDMPMVEYFEEEQDEGHSDMDYDMHCEEDELDED